MLTIILAGTGSQLVFPHGASIEDGEKDSEIAIKDESGKTLAILQRSAFSMFSTDPLVFKEMEDGAREQGNSHSGK